MFLLLLRSDRFKLILSPLSASRQKDRLAGYMHAGEIELSVADIAIIDLAGAAFDYSKWARRAAVLIPTSALWAGLHFLTVPRV